MIDTGVYEIRCLTNKKVYIGSASCSFKKRFASHRSALLQGRHHNGHLQAAWNRYGESSFEFRVIEECEPSNCLVREQHWIDTTQCTDRAIGFNMRPKAESNLGVRHSEQSRRNMSAALKRRVRRKETYVKIADILRGYKHTAETKRRFSICQKGKKHSQATKEKMSKTRTGRKYSNEWRQSISLALRSRYEKLRTDAGDFRERRRRGEPVIAVCAECGKDFRKISGTKLCSQECCHRYCKRTDQNCRCEQCQAARQERLRDGIQCGECGKRFTPYAPRAKGCSPECCRMLKRKRDHVSRKARASAQHPSRTRARKETSPQPL